jgi:hypothetical protein
MSLFNLKTILIGTQRTPLANCRCAPSKLAADALALIDSSATPVDSGHLDRQTLSVLLYILLLIFVYFIMIRIHIVRPYVTIVAQWRG